MSQFAFKRTGDADYPRHLKVLLQGPPKSGKTTFLTTAPNVVVAAVEAGLMSIAHLDVPYVDVDRTDKLQSLQLVLGDDALRAQAAQHLGLPDIETVAIDTLDAWQEVLKKEILKENKRTAFQRDDWGTLKERMAVVLKAFVALPVNVIFTVHTTTTQDEESKMIYAPGLQGSIKDEIAGYVDFSLLSFRQRETDRNGKPVIKYYLKNEGDQKNPHLGNRAAGRLPEICEPNFKILHDAVFSGITRRPLEPVPETITIQSPGSTPAILPAQTVSQPTGVPADDPNAPINAAGISMLTKEYTAQGFHLPQDLKEWDLAKARQIAKYFVAWKADRAAGQGTRDDLVQYLQAMEAFAGEIEGLQTGVENLMSTPAKPEEPPAEPVTQTAPEAEEGEKSQGPTDEEVEAQAVELIEQQLGGVLIGQKVEKDATCDVCGKPVDDLDVADLGLRRYRKTLCVEDYKAETRKQ
jgi:hypothetical protein